MSMFMRRAGRVRQPPCTKRIVELVRIALEAAAPVHALIASREVRAVDARVRVGPVEEIERPLRSASRHVHLAPQGLAEGRVSDRGEVADADARMRQVAGRPEDAVIDGIGRELGGGVLSPHAKERCERPPAAAKSHSVALGRKPPSQMQNAYAAYQSMQVIGRFSRDRRSGVHE